MSGCEDAQTISFPRLCHAPFTDEQIKSIREYQRCEFVHALTCEEHSNVALTAATAGLRCPMSGCRYSQGAVHEMIANGEWRATADRIREFLQHRESKSYANENEAEA